MSPRLSVPRPLRRAATVAFCTLIGLVALAAPASAAKPGSEFAVKPHYGGHATR